MSIETGKAANRRFNVRKCWSARIVVGARETAFAVGLEDAADAAHPGQHRLAGLIEEEYGGALALVGVSLARRRPRVRAQATSGTTENAP